MFFRASLAPTLLLAALPACNSDRPRAPGSSASATPAADTAAAARQTAAKEVETVHVTAKEYAFGLPQQVPAGTVRLHLMNQGKELHHAQIVRLDDGKTVDDLVRALKKPGPPPPWLRLVGGPNATVPGQEANSTQTLEPGRYAALCFIPATDGVMHALKGMIRAFEVTGSAPVAAAALPAAEATIRLVDYDFEMSKSLTRGRHTLLVENAGPQPHELQLLKLAPGKTARDFGEWAETGMKGPPPAQPIGGVAFLDRGKQAVFSVDLEAGDYALICFVPDTKDGRPHLAHGMMKDFKVT